MIMDRFPALKVFFLSIVGTLICSLVACGGSSGGALVSGNDRESPNAPVGGDFGFLPDFVILDIVLPPTYSRIGDDLSVLLRVANIGDKAAIIPGGWLMLSDTEDFSTGYAIHPFQLAPVGDGSSRLVEPGEERDFRALLDLPLSRNGVHYTRAWLNPDLSAYFMNPEEFVVSSHEQQEKDFDNNVSELRSLEVFEFDLECLSDALEENDTITTAAPILLDTQYTINACDEQLDVFSLSLQEGVAYELSLTHDTLEWPRAIVDEEGRYLETATTESPLIFRTVTRGPHYLVMRYSAYDLGRGRGVNFIIRQLPD